jgi:hypothetical protein
MGRLEVEMKGTVFRWRGEKDGYLAALLLSKERRPMIQKVKIEPLPPKRDWVRVSPYVVKVLRPDIIMA